MNPVSCELRIVIADDEPLARDRLRRLLSRVDGVLVVGEARCGMDALTLIESEQPDVAILDVQMPDITGLHVIRSLDDPPAIILSTAHEQYAVEAFELEVVDYLLKPYSAERLQKAIERAGRLLRRQGEPAATESLPRLAALDGNATVLVPIERILQLRLEETVVFLLRDDGEKLICEENLKELEPKLPESAFFRANRQAIVNLDRVQSYRALRDGSVELTLSGGCKVCVSRRRARHFYARIQQHTGGGQ